MNTQHLQYIIEIERTRSISQAAENLFLGQPNLSRIRPSDGARRKVPQARAQYAPRDGLY